MSIPQRQFLRLVNEGKKLELGKRAAVIGGNNMAMEVARSLLRLGAERCHYYLSAGQD